MPPNPYELYNDPRAGILCRAWDEDGNTEEYWADSYVKAQDWCDEQEAMWAVGSRVEEGQT